MFTYLSRQRDNHAVILTNVPNTFSARLEGSKIDSHNSFLDIYHKEMSLLCLANFPLDHCLLRFLKKTSIRCLPYHV